MSFLAAFAKKSDINLDRNSNNFDFLRLFAASLVIIAHSSIIFLNKPTSFDPVAGVFGIEMGTFGVTLFFIISGFLIAMSWESKKNISGFFMARFLRIYPAAIIVVLLSVFLLGLLLTNLTLKEYLCNRTTHLYLQNTSLYRMYYYLPGVFTNNPCGSSINGSLWTLPYEFTCYLFLALIGLLSGLKNKFVTLAIFVVLSRLCIL